ncbi:unnamed protein product [Cylicocyclus nassatus]|uniref:Endoplasmic reticulum-Golgi intermediate compartment protein 3 n=1 Tax=Cylicocyclus nassatus TaxID=53992 RepID=A0AA36M5V6_CYLNA|nr:unnamed protein product [Cylicocyclus nassatus]
MRSSNIEETAEDSDYYQDKNKSPPPNYLGRDESNFPESTSVGKTMSQKHLPLLMSMFTKLREFDAYTKPMEDFRVKTLIGGLVTVMSTIAIVLLAIQETSHYLAGDVVEQLYVDSTTSDTHLDVHFDITFHRLPCEFIAVDVMDVTSADQDDIQHNIFKLRLDKDGKNITSDVQKIEVNQNITTAVVLPECGSCYGALPDGRKYDPWLKKLRQYEGEGCRVYGKLQVAKVAGNFHLAPGEARRIQNTHGAS